MVQDYAYPSTGQKPVAEERGEDCVRKAAFSVCVFSSLPQFNDSVAFQSMLEDIGLFAFNNLMELAHNTDFL